MARPLRIEYEGAVYHVTSRGNARQPIFKDDADREIFLHTLTRVNKRYHWLCHAYCLMDNHTHLIIETPEGNLSQGMRQLNGVYTQTFNRKHQQVGHLFQGRYKAILVERESYLLEVCRYVVLNPVRAKGVKHPEEWKWSSYWGTGGFENPHPCLTTHWILGQFGTRKEQSTQRYREFVKAGIGGNPIWEKLKGPNLLGDEAFVDRVSRYIKGHEAIREIPRSQRFLNRPRLEDLFKEKAHLKKQRRDQQIAEAVEVHGYSQKEVADYLKMHYSTISRLVNQKNLEMSKDKT